MTHDFKKARDEYEAQLKWGSPHSREINETIIAALELAINVEYNKACFKSDPAQGKYQEGMRDMLDLIAPQPAPKAGE